MSQKQLAGLIAGGAIVILLGILVYQNFRSSDMIGENLGSDPMMAMPEEKPVPENVDDIALEIESETALDTAALNEELAAENAEIESDTQSFNNLSESYDPNSF